MAMDLEQLVIRVSSQYTGGQGMRTARGDVNKLEQGTKSLNRALLAMGTAITAGVALSLNQFNKMDMALTEFAHKAGMVRKEFQGIYGDAARTIAIASGAQQIRVMEGLQRGASLQLTPEANKRLTGFAAVLDSANQARVVDVIEASVGLHKQGFGQTPEEIAQKTYLTSQIGAGDVTQYFRAAQGISSIGNLVGLQLDQMLAGLALISNSTSLPEAQTQMRAFLTQISNPTGSAANIFQERTGEDMTVLKDILRSEQGLGGVVRYLSENFSKDELLEIFDRRSARFIGSVLDNVDTLEINTAKIARAEQVDPIGRLRRDTEEAWSSSIQAFREARQEFWNRWGAVYAAILKPFLDFATGFLDIMFRVDDKLGGVISGLGALTAGMAFLLTAVRGLSWILGLDAASALGGILDVAGRRNQDIGPDGRSQTGEGLGAWVRSILTGLIAAMGAQFSSLKESISAAVKTARITPWTKLSVDYGLRNFLMAATIGTAGALLTTPLGLILTTLIGMSALLMFIYKDTEKIRKIREADAPRRAHFARGGTEVDAPAPGLGDIRDANAAKRQAESDRINEELREQLKLQWGFDFDFDGIGELIAAFLWWAWEWTMHKLFGSVGEWLKKKIHQWSMNTRESILFWGFGKAPEHDLENLGKIVDDTESGPNPRMTQHAIEMSPEQLKAFGLSKIGPGLLNAPNVDFSVYNDLPHPPSQFQQSDLNPYAGKLGPHPPVFNFHTNVTVESNNPDAQPEEIGEVVRRVVKEEKVKEAWEITEALDGISPYSP